MKRIFLSLVLVFLYSESSAQDFFAVKYNNSIQKNEIWRVNTENSTQTKLAEIRFPGNGWQPQNSFLSEKTGELYMKNSEGYFNVYNAKTNTFREILNDPAFDDYQQSYEIPDKFIDDVISVTSEDAEIKIDETNNTVNIDNAALSDGDGTNMITLEDDGSVSLGGDDMVVIDDEGISIDGKQLIAEKEDGAIHIGENSLITVEQDGVQKLYAEDENGDAIDIDITNGSDLLINGVSVEERLNSNNRTYVDTVANNLFDGIEDSNAMSAALAALPNTAPDAEAYCGGGLGSYGNSQAFSLGCASNINDNFAVNFGASKLSSGGASVGNREFDDYSLKAGFIYKIGYKPSKSSKSNTATLETELYRQQASLRAIAEKENYKDTKIAEYEKRLANLEEQKAIEAAEYEHKFTKLEEQLEELKVAMLAGNKEFASLAK